MQLSYSFDEERHQLIDRRKGWLLKIIEWHLNVLDDNLAFKGLLNDLFGLLSIGGAVCQISKVHFYAIIKFLNSGNVLLLRHKIFYYTSYINHCASSTNSPYPRTFGLFYLWLWLLISNTTSFLNFLFFHQLYKHFKLTNTNPITNTMTTHETTPIPESLSILFNTFYLFMWLWTQLAHNNSQCSCSRYSKGQKQKQILLSSLATLQ